MKIEVYLDDNPLPIDVLTPPEKFKLDTTKLEDGKHQLTFKATNRSGITSLKIVPFFVQNGPAIAVHGLKKNEEVSDEITILANAYSSNVGDEFEPMLMETPAPIPTWSWVLLLIIIGWGAGYISLELHDRMNDKSLVASGHSTASSKTETSNDGGSSWADLGKQVYGNNCSSCHQASGTGLPGVFPPLKGNSVVLDDDPTEHIKAVLDGVKDKVIDGVNYASPMPGFAASLSDEEIAAVVNHERTQWGNNAKTITAEEVAKLRK